MKIGQKGQIVIPKVFREEYGLDPKTEVTLQDVGEGILLQKPYVDIVEEFARLARSSKKKATFDLLHGIEEEYEERMHRSGLL